MINQTALNSLSHKSKLLDISMTPLPNNTQNEKCSSHLSTPNTIYVYKLKFSLNIKK